MQSNILTLCCIASALLTVRSQQFTSPCPNVFRYEPKTESDRWYGVIQLSTDVELHSIWIDIELDRPAHILGNWYGSVSSTDNKKFTITNRKRVLLPGPATPVRIFVKYAEVDDIPIITGITINGRVICPPSISRDELAAQTEQNIYLQTGGVANPGRKTTTTTTQRPLLLQQIAQNQQQLIQQQQQILQQQQHQNSVNQQQTPRPNQQNGRPNNQQNGNRPTQVNPNTFNSGSNEQNGRPNNQQNANRPSQVNPNTFNSGSNENQFEETTRRPSYGTSAEDFDFISRPTSTVEDNDDGFQGDFRPNRKPALPRPKPTQSIDLTPSPTCGLVASQARPLITHGQETKKGMTPWHAAIYRSAGIDLSYICGASLISLGHVVTAAHCVARQRSIRPIDHETLQIYLGKYNLRIWNDEGIQQRSVDQIYIHPEFNYTSFLNDVAVLKFREPVEYTSYVRPVCLWRESSDLKTVISREGTVVGWGYDESGRVTNQLAMAKMPVVNEQTCLRSYPDFFPKFTSEKTYCAGFRNGTSVCNGDSGGGMVFPTPNTEPVVWELRGLVSVSVALQNEFICDAHHYVVFTDLAKHNQWLQATMKRQ